MAAIGLQEGDHPTNGLLAARGPLFPTMKIVGPLENGPPTVRLFQDAVPYTAPLEPWTRGDNSGKS